MGNNRQTALGFTLASLLATPCAHAADYRDNAEVERFIGSLTREYGFADEQLHQLFDEVQRKQGILDAISRPAERVRPWSEYRPIFITDSRISRGVDFWRQNEAALTRAEAEYGVPARYIVAIIGVETFYGRNTGSYRVLDALSTLCFDYPPRADFFCKQLREFLLLSREEQVDPLSLKGSYAGAMGLPQFMPGSFRAYAVDFDGDGHIDIWGDPIDAIGSVANYFKEHGWQRGQAVAMPAQVSGERVEQSLSPGLEPSLNARQLREFGWTPAQPLADELSVGAFRLDGAKGPEYWVGLPNFYVITRYNRSVMYAMAVEQLAQSLEQARGER